VQTGDVCFNCHFACDIHSEWSLSEDNHALARRNGPHIRIVRLALKVGKLLCGLSVEGPGAVACTIFLDIF